HSELRRQRLFSPSAALSCPSVHRPSFHRSAGARTMFGRPAALIHAVALAVCGTASSAALAQNLPFTLTQVADFDSPWALEFLPDGRLLVSEMRGGLKLYAPSGAISEIRGVPQVSYGGQGG